MFEVDTMHRGRSDKQSSAIFANQISTHRERGKGVCVRRAL